jgi:hypothetical protein
MRKSTPQEVSRRAREVYERDIRPRVEPEHAGRFLVLDVESGAYALADDELDAFDRARAKAPEGVLYLLRVGRRAAHRVGARRTP